MSLSHNESSHRRAKKFFEELDRQLRRHSPREYGAIASTVLHNLIGRIDLWRFYPPHMLINSIEANCAYHRGHRNEPVTKRRIDEILNHYKDYYDPYLEYVLHEQNLDLFALAMHRQQFEFQKAPNLRDLARCLFLFTEENPLPEISSLFTTEYGFDMQDWIMMCFAVHAHSNRMRPPIVRSENYIDSEVKFIPGHMVIPFLKLSSLDPGEFATVYRNNRREIPSYLHIHIRSAFLEHPLISYDDGTYLVVHPNLIFHHAQDGLYTKCQDLNPDIFANEFGRSFEEYVGRLLKELKSNISFIHEAEISQESEGQVCDYLIETDDSIVLIECKATQYSANLFTENAIKGDNSTGKIAGAYEQLHATADRLSRGELSRLVTANNKPIYGIVVTFGDIPFPNSDWYFNNAISNRMEQEILNDWPSPLHVRPQVIPISAFEEIIIISNDLDLSLGKLIDTKLSQDYYHSGDWPQYIGVYKDQVTDWSFPILDDATHRFLGVAF